MKQTYTISIKGYIPTSITDYWTEKMFSDISFGYSTITFTGTEEELNTFCSEQSKDNSLFKIIGVTP